MAKMHGIEAVEFVKESNPNAPSLNSDKKGTPQDEILRCPFLNHRYVMPLHGTQTRSLFRAPIATIHDQQSLLAPTNS